MKAAFDMDSFQLNPAVVYKNATSVSVQILKVTCKSFGVQVGGKQVELSSI